MAIKKTFGTYFKSLKLDNVRSFGNEQFLDLTDESGKLAQWTLIVGDNGIGKTTLLQSLGWMRPVLIEGSDSPDTNELIKKGIVGAALQDEEIEIIKSILRDSSSKNTFEMYAEFQQRATFDSTLSDDNENQIKTQIKSNFKNNGFFESLNQEIETNIEKKLNGKFWEPFVIAYGANRHMGIQNIDKNDLEEPLGNRLSDYTELYDLEEILTELKFSAVSKDNKGKEYDFLTRVLDTLAKLLPDDKTKEDFIIEAGEFIKDDFKKSSVKLNTFSGIVSFSRLSLGYQTMLAWVLDLAWRLNLRYYKSDNPLDKPATVLIDEIDLHLHPQWQVIVMDTLADLFKGTQFIATAHSPLMVQSKPNTNFAVITKNGKESLIENEPDKVHGWGIDQILEHFFGMSKSKKSETQKLFKERNQLLLKPNRSIKEENRLMELEEEILAVGSSVVWEKQQTFNSIRKRKENKK